MFEGYRAKVARTPCCRRFIDFLPEDLNAVFNIERGILHQIQWLIIGIGQKGDYVTTMMKHTDVAETTLNAISEDCGDNGDVRRACIHCFRDNIQYRHRELR